MDNRPIKASKNGKYNLNFIDWNNEWERVNEIEKKIENDEYISDEEEKNRVVYYKNKEKLKNGLRFNKNIRKIYMNSQYNSKECYICLCKFEFSKQNIKNQIIELSCKHIFHDKCIQPWLKYNHVCPTCKFNLKEEGEEDEDYE